MSNITKAIQETAEETRDYLKSYFKNQKTDTKLFEAMEYGVFPGGKMIRSFLVKSSFKTLGIEEKLYLPVAAAVECIHSYSLIHDDLPAMDNDDFRRGKESTHKAFGEYTAILAGSSLLTLAFEILTDPKTDFTSDIKNNLIYSLATSSGHQGIAGGQFMDLSLKKKNITKESVIDMQNKKTGELMGFCTESAAIVSNQDNLREKFKNIGVKIGLIFQIADDFLDKYGDKDKIGKPVKQDDVKGKNTLINLLGDDEAKQQAQSFLNEIKQDLEKFLPKSEELISCAEYILNREK